MPEITLIPKKEKPEFKLSFSKLIFYFPATLFIVVVLVFGGFFLYNFILNKKIVAVEEEIGAVESQRDLEADKEFIAKIFNLGVRIRSLKAIFDNRFHGSAIFPFFEKLTLPQTRYFNFIVDFPKESISVKGETGGYVDLVKQMIVFSNDSNVKEAIFSGITLSPGGKVTFSLELKFNKKILLETEE